MTKLDAYKQTKKKWEWIIENSPNNWGHPSAPGCGFCEYAFEGVLAFSLACVRCPVYSITRKISCEDTPYHMKNNLKNALIEYDFLNFVALSEGII